MEESHWRELHGGVPMCRGQTTRNQEKKYREGEAICLPLTTIIKTAFTDTRLTEDEISTFGWMGIGLGLVLLFHSSTTASSTLPPSIFLKKNNTLQQLSRSDLSLSLDTQTNCVQREMQQLIRKWKRFPVVDRSPAASTGTPFPHPSKRPSQTDGRTDVVNLYIRYEVG